MLKRDKVDGGILNKEVKNEKERSIHSIDYSPVMCLYSNTIGLGRFQTKT